MTDVRTAHTADLDPSTLEAAHELLTEVFHGDFSEQDWEHALGGVHALAWEGDELVGHASLVQRRLLHGGRGWKRWHGPTSALTPAGVTRTPDEDGGVYVFPLTAPLDLSGELTCDWRDGDVW